MSRGNSIIAGVVLIGVLGTFSIALQATTPSTNMVARNTVTPKSQVAATQETAKTPPEATECTPGYVYNVRMKDKKSEVTCEPNSDAQAQKKLCPRSDNCKLQAPPGMETAKGNESFCLKPASVYTCIPSGFAGCSVKVDGVTGEGDKAPTEYTVYENAGFGECCKPVEGGCATKGDKKFVSSSEVSGRELANLAAEAAKNGDTLTVKEIEEMQKANKADPGFMNGFNNAFKEQVAEQEEKEQEARSLLAKEQEKLNGCSSPYPCDRNARDAAQITLEKEQKRLADMKAMQSRLAAAQTSLKPPPNAPCTGAGCSGGGGNGGGGNGAGGGSGSGAGGQRPPSTFPGGGQQPPQQQPPQNPYQQCSPQHFCINSTLYWGNNNQQNANTYYGTNNPSNQNSCQTQVVQRCQHGCQGNACAPAPRDQNPGAKTPVATLTCGTDRPYDVGMNVPLQFSCKDSETSKGSGFSTNNRMNGSTTAEIKKPPPGADIVSYGLTCVAQGGRTDSARCDVQINVPSIVLIANPKEVALNASTTIGWVTQGMKSCTITSPDADAGSALEEFNDENADNTSVSGVAVTPGLEDETTFKLSCITRADGNKEAAIKVKVP